jgi:hypothetical protein
MPQDPARRVLGPRHAGSPGAVVDRATGESTALVSPSSYPPSTIVSLFARLAPVRWGQNTGGARPDSRGEVAEGGWTTFADTEMCRSSRSIKEGKR